MVKYYEQYLDFQPLSESRPHRGGELAAAVQGDFCCDMQILDIQLPSSQAALLSTEVDRSKLPLHNE